MYILLEKSLKLGIIVLEIFIFNTTFIKKRYQH